MLGLHKVNKSYSLITIKSEESGEHNILGYGMVTDFWMAYAK